MSKIYLKSIFMHRSDTAENWSEKNPVLKKGEAGVELGNPAAVKIGDGETPWNALEYSAANALKQDKFASVTETGTSDGKKRTTLTGKAGNYVTLKSQESLSLEGRGIELKPSNGCLKLNSGNGSGMVRVQNVAEPTVPSEAATKNYVDTAIVQTGKTKQDKFAEVSENSVKITKPFTVSTGGWPGDGLPVKLYGSEIYLGAGDSDEERITVEAGNLVVHQSPREGTEGAYDVPNIGYLRANFVRRSELETDLTVTYGEDGVYYSLANAAADSRNIYCIIKGSDIGDGSIKKMRLRNVSEMRQDTADIIEFSGIVTTGGKTHMLSVHALLNNSAKSVTWEIAKNAEIAEVL